MTDAAPPPAPPIYTAVINVDYTRSENPGYQRILQALDEAGWAYVETSAMVYKGPLEGVLLGLEILARAIPPGGLLSALTVQVQLVGTPRHAPGPETTANALRNALANPLPPRPHVSN